MGVRGGPGDCLLDRPYTTLAVGPPLPHWLNVPARRSTGCERVVAQEVIEVIALDRALILFQ